MLMTASTKVGTMRPLPSHTADEETHTAFMTACTRQLTSHAADVEPLPRS